MIAPATPIKTNEATTVAMGVFNPDLPRFRDLRLTRLDIYTTIDGTEAIGRDIHGSVYRVTVEPIHDEQGAER